MPCQPRLEETGWQPQTYTRKGINSRSESALETWWLFLLQVEYIKKLGVKLGTCVFAWQHLEDNTHGTRGLSYTVSFSVNNWTT